MPGAAISPLRTEDALDGIGFADAEIDELLAGLADEGLLDIEDEGPGDPPDEPVSRPGDLWLMGDHRLLCGDSRDPATFARLLDGQRADLVWTDPPYGVDYEGKSRRKTTWST